MIMGDNGQMRRVDYVADADGFRADVKTNEVGTRSENSADVQYTVEVPSLGQLMEANISQEAYDDLERRFQIEKTSQINNTNSQSKSKHLNNQNNNNNDDNFQDIANSNQRFVSSYNQNNNQARQMQQSNLAASSVVKVDSRDQSASSLGNTVLRQPTPIAGSESDSSSVDTDELGWRAKSARLQAKPISVESATTPTIFQDQQSQNQNQQQETRVDEPARGVAQSVQSQQITKQQANNIKWQPQVNNSAQTTVLEGQLAQQFNKHSNQLEEQDYPRRSQPDTPSSTPVNKVEQETNDIKIQAQDESSEQNNYNDSSSKPTMTLAQEIGMVLRAMQKVSDDFMKETNNMNSDQLQEQQLIQQQEQNQEQAKVDTSSKLELNEDVQFMQEGGVQLTNIANQQQEQQVVTSSGQQTQSSTSINANQQQIIKEPIQDQFQKPQPNINSITGNVEQQQQELVPPTTTLRSPVNLKESSISTSTSFPVIFTQTNSSHGTQTSNQPQLILEDQTTSGPVDIPSSSVFPQIERIRPNIERISNFNNNNVQFPAGAVKTIAKRPKQQRQPPLMPTLSPVNNKPVQQQAQQRETSFQMTNTPGPKQSTTGSATSTMKTPTFSTEFSPEKPTTNWRQQQQRKQENWTAIQASQAQTQTQASPAKDSSSFDFSSSSSSSSERPQLQVVEEQIKVVNQPASKTRISSNQNKDKFWKLGQEGALAASTQSQRTFVSRKPSKRNSVPLQPDSGVGVSLFGQRVNVNRI